MVSEAIRLSSTETCLGWAERELHPDEERIAMQARFTPRIIRIDNVVPDLGWLNGENWNDGLLSAERRPFTEPRRTILNP